MSAHAILQLDNRVGYQPRWDVWGRFTQVSTPLLLDVDVPNPATRTQHKTPFIGRTPPHQSRLHCVSVAAYCSSDQPLGGQNERDGRVC